MQDCNNCTDELISVILPTYNRKDCVLNAINCILEQTYNNLELIIIDDGSTDGTQELVSSLKDDRIVYIYQENGGACKARNNGIAAARGEYIAFQDSDDLSLPERLEKQLKFLIENKADVVFCKMKCIDNGEIRGCFPANIQEGIYSPDKHWGGIGTSAVFGKTSVFRDCKFDNQIPRLQDFELLMRISVKYTMYYLDEVLVNWNLSHDSISFNTEKGISAVELIVKKHSNMLAKYPKMAEELRNISINLMKEVIDNDQQLSRIANVIGCLRLSDKNDSEGWIEELRYLIKLNEKLESQLNEQINVNKMLKDKYNEQMAQNTTFIKILRGIRNKLKLC